LTSSILKGLMIASIFFMSAPNWGRGRKNARLAKEEL
jgi:hypothetical protein